MNQITEYDEVAERAVLVGVGLSDMSKSEVEESLNELGRLADTAGADEIDRIVQFRDRPDAAYFIGKGKLHASHNARNSRKKRENNIRSYP